MRDKLVNLVLDTIWNVTLPISGTCCVCAFWRGMLGGVALSLLTMLGSHYLAGAL